MQFPQHSLWLEFHIRADDLARLRSTLAYVAADAWTG